jgi:hypothetical protein
MKMGKNEELTRALYEHNPVVTPEQFRRILEVAIARDKNETSTARAYWIGALAGSIVGMAVMAAAWAAAWGAWG